MSTSDDGGEQTEQGGGEGKGAEAGAASLISESVDSCGEDRKGVGEGVPWRVKDEIETSARGRCGDQGGKDR